MYRGAREPLEGLPACKALEQGSFVLCPGPWGWRVSSGTTANLLGGGRILDKAEATRASTRNKASYGHRSACV